MNYYGLSALNDQEYNLKLAFPYNELLWFINCKVRSSFGANLVSVQRIVMVYHAKHKILSSHHAFPYNELLWFIT